MKYAYKMDYKIIGVSIQVIEINLAPLETVIAEAGALLYLEQNIAFETKMSDGSTADNALMKKLIKAWQRMLTGESVFITHFTNNSQQQQKVAFSAPYPGTILALDLAEHGEELMLQKDCFMAASLGTEISMTFIKKIRVGLFGGEGFILQHLKGDGLVFVHAGGVIIRKELNGETLKVDTGCLVGFTRGIKYDIEKSGSFKTMMLGGEGLFLASLQGHGTVWLHSLPFSRMANKIVTHAPSKGGKSKGEGSILGGLGRLIGGRR